MGEEAGMSTLHDAFVWLNDPANYEGPDGVWHRLEEHITITVIAVVVAGVIAVPLASWLGHTGRGGGVTVVVSNLTRAMPTLVLLIIFATTPIGFGNRATTIAVTIFAIPPLLTNTYVGIREVDREAVEAARGMGFTEMQVLTRVELPLAVPLIAAGFRTAAVQVVATAALAALVGGGTLGAIINLGYGQQDKGQILAGAFLVAALALVTEALLALVQRMVTPARERRGGGAPEVSEPDDLREDVERGEPIAA
jgi:osmoprotectant transport system permease protein